MITPWEVFNVVSIVPTTICEKNSLRFVSLIYFSLGLYIETGKISNTEAYKDYNGSRSSAVDIVTQTTLPLFLQRV
jgi:hypothetical protein